MLTELLTLDVYRFLMLFVRLGAGIMLLPGLGGQVVAVRIRLLLALSFSALMVPLLGPTLPPPPGSVGALLVLIFGEAVIGLYLGTVISFVMAALNVAGAMIGYMTGLTNAFSFDNISQQQSQLVTGFLSNLAMVAIFATNLHHMIFQALVESYILFAPGQPLPWGDFSQMLSQLLNGSFRIGIQFSAPLVVFGLVFYSGLGVLSRLVPQLQVFFVAMPVQMLIGMAMFMASMSMIIGLFLRYMEDILTPYLTPG